jgi:predicted RNA-binding Zn ribbon-like protein
METPSWASIRLNGGDVALDFTNTADSDTPGGDHLRSYADFLGWLERVGLPAAPGTLAEVRAVRERIDAALRPFAENSEPASIQHGLRGLRELELAALSRATLRKGGWEWVDPAPLDRLVHAATTLVLDGRARRIGRCGNCSWLFLDHSRGRSRRWCSMESCGTEVKIRRLTERRRTSRQAG